MTVQHQNGTAHIVRFSFDINELPKSLQRGLDAAPTAKVEQEGQTLIQNDFPEDMSEDFVRSVCRWGNNPFIFGMVLNRNDASKVANSLRQAHHKTQNGNLKAALEIMLTLNGLGVSFASKHLKFLDPERHVVLDSIIRKRLGYPDTSEGYYEFVSDCKDVLSLVQGKGILRCDGKPFRIADVEMAIYNMPNSKSNATG